MGKLISGLRPGVSVHLEGAGLFRNGSDPSPVQAKALKAAGHKLVEFKGGFSLDPDAYSALPTDDANNEIVQANKDRVTGEPGAGAGNAPDGKPDGA